jgi:hypothetical protein
MVVRVGAEYIWSLMESRQEEMKHTKVKEAWTKPQDSSDNSNVFQEREKP